MKFVFTKHAAIDKFAMLKKLKRGGTINEDKI